MRPATLPVVPALSPDPLRPGYRSLSTGRAARSRHAGDSGVAADRARLQDRDLARRLEPRAPTPEARRRAVGACALRLRSASRKRYLPVIREHFPALPAKDEATYPHSVYAADNYCTGLQQVIERLCRKYGLTTREDRRDDGDGDDDVALPVELAPELQLALL